MPGYVGVMGGKRMRSRLITQFHGYVRTALIRINAAATAPALTPSCVVRTGPIGRLDPSSLDRNQTGVRTAMVKQSCAGVAKTRAARG